MLIYSIEIIIVDDGSTDGLFEIYKNLSDSDKRIKVFSKQNEEPASAREFGVKHAFGEYISFVDSDDYVEINAYETILFKENNDLWDIIEFGYIKYINGLRRKIRKRQYYL